MKIGEGKIISSILESEIVEGILKLFTSPSEHFFPFIALKEEADNRRWNRIIMKIESGENRQKTQYKQKPKNYNIKLKERKTILLQKKGKYRNM